MRTKGINFSYAYSRGSKTDRINKMKTIRSEIFDNVIKEFDKPQETDPSKKIDAIPISSLKKLVQEKLPEPLRFNLKKVPPSKRSELDGSVGAIYTDEGAIYYHMIVAAEKNQLPIKHLPTLMHETTHLLDSALQPQYALTEYKLCKKGLIDKAVNFYLNEFYTGKMCPKFITKMKTRKFLKNMSIEDKLLSLKLFKLNMETEVRAYAADAEFSNKISPWNGQHIHGFNPINYQRCNFEEKIKLVDEMRAELINKERNKIKKMHNK